MDLVEEEEHDFLIKIVIIGDSGVGKTNLLSQWYRHEFSEKTASTIGVEFGWQMKEIDGKRVKAQIWDTAGQDRFRSVAQAYYRGAMGALVVYDITNRSSFVNISKWLEELKQHAEPNAVVMLAGNKCDLDTRNISEDEGREFATKNGMLFMETSARTAANVDSAFTSIITEIYTNNFSPAKPVVHKEPTVKVKPAPAPAPAPPKKKFC
ncbi:Rab family protein [Pelomyxa schiedti]|nr:Rab family protein [Pelomyxa schiedti]